MAAPQHDDGARSALRLVFLCNNAVGGLRLPKVLKKHDLTVFLEYNV
jgi:hypothetical protein